MKLFISAACLCLLISLLWIRQKKLHNATETTNLISQEITVPDSITHITISAVGDLMCHSSQYKYTHVEADSFDFLPSFEKVLPWLQKPDLLAGNLETTLAGTKIPYSGYPRFNTPDDYAEALKKAGFDFIITANNHSNDTGEKGILRTIQILKENNLSQTGTFTSQKDRDSIRILDVKGIKIGMIAFTYSTNGIDITPGKPWLVNYCDSALIKNDIFLAREAGAEIVVVFYHFGNEYERIPGPYQNNFVNWAIENGADIIIGSHPHVIQPVNFFKTRSATLDTGFVAYSLGNFISNQRDNFADEGIIINVHISKNMHTKQIKIDYVDYVPTWVYRGVNPEKKLHIIFPVMDHATFGDENYISNIEMKEMQDALQNTGNIISTYINSVKPATK
ncbi:MAG: CapA family protein [Chitinophagales bacterium]|nr:CapA family protein [Chitinophagales bacterium]